MVHSNQELLAMEVESEVFYCLDDGDHFLSRHTIVALFR